MIRRNCRKTADTLVEHPITFAATPLIDKGSKVLALGSCFALRVKEFLLAHGYGVLNEGDLRPWANNGRAEFDPRIYYNTFCIRYELERLTGEFVQAEDDYWEPHSNAARLFQDPYRRMLCAPDRDALWSRIREVDAQMRQHLLAADLVIITLGLTEVFFQQHNERAICAAPGYCGGGGIGTAFRSTEYPENYDNLEQVVRILKEVNPRAQLLLTVSPVPLGNTFAPDTDHAIANTESKSVLRAVAGAIVRKYDHVHYFHSYELVMHSARGDVFLEDGRHVQSAYVAGIMSQFEQQYVRTAPLEPRPSMRRGPRFIDLSTTLPSAFSPAPAR
ncbi:MAG TPA: GSCFA domain-containing protein [Pirellulales bacterium]|jgi:hypothetical protein|nr:GSCFA domain-containing protein [Pirellulales bacterium]